MEHVRLYHFEVDCLCQLWAESRFVRVRRRKQCRGPGDALCNMINLEDCRARKGEAGNFRCREIGGIDRQDRRPHGDLEA